MALPFRAARVAMRMVMKREKAALWRVNKPCKVAGTGGV